MKKTLPEFTQRLYTAVPLVSVIVAATFYFNFFVFIVLNTFLTLRLGWEWVHVMGGSTRFFYYSYSIALFIGCLSVYYLPIEWVSALSGLMGALLVGGMGFAVSNNHRPQYPIWLLASLGGVCLVLSWYTLCFLKQAPIYLGMGLLVIMLTDTLSYLAGKCWGVHRLAPVISPNKTWEGFFAGLFGPTIFIFIIDVLSGYPFYVDSQMIGLVVLTSLTAIAGDLFESAVKRQSGIKDSGSGLPGHGGWMDRCDSLVCAIPVFSAGLFYLAIL